MFVIVAFLFFKSCGAFKITHLFIPQQHGTPDSCDMEGEEDLIFYQDKFDLVTLGWIHVSFPFMLKGLCVGGFEFFSPCSQQVSLKLKLQLQKLTTSWSRLANLHTCSYFFCNVHDMHGNIREAL